MLLVVIGRDDRGMVLYGWLWWYMVYYGYICYALVSYGYIWFSLIYKVRSLYIDAQPMRSSAYATYSFRTLFVCSYGLCERIGTTLSSQRYESGIDAAGPAYSKAI